MCGSWVLNDTIILFKKWLLRLIAMITVLESIVLSKDSRIVSRGLFKYKDTEYERCCVSLFGKGSLSIEVGVNIRRYGR